MTTLRTGAGSDKPQQELIPAAVHEGRLYGIVDIGIQTVKDYTTQEDKSVPQIMLFFELPDFQMEFEKDGEKLTAPRVISETYTNSAGKKAKLRGFLESLTGKDISEIDLEKCLGMPSMVTVKHKTSKTNGKTYVNIDAFGVMSEKYAKNLAKQHNPDMYFIIGEHGFESENFDKLYGWVKERIKKSQEYKEFETAGGNVSSSKDDCPFE